MRRPRVEKIIATAARANNTKAAGPIARIVRDAMMPLALRTVVTPEKMFGWLHTHRIDFDSPVDSVPPATPV